MGYSLSYVDNLLGETKSCASRHFPNNPHFFVSPIIDISAVAMAETFISFNVFYL